MDERLSFILGLIHKIGSDTEDKAEVYRGAAEAASGKLQAFHQMKLELKKLRKDKLADGKTLKLLVGFIDKEILSNEKSLTVAVAKQEVTEELVSYLNTLRQKVGSSDG